MAAAYALAKSEAHSTPPSPSTDAPGAYAGAVSESDEPAPSSSMDVPRGLTSSTPQYSSQSAEWSLSSTDINSEGFIPNFSSTPYQQFNSSTSCDDVEIKFSAEMGSLGLRSTVSDRQTDNSSERVMSSELPSIGVSGQPRLTRSASKSIATALNTASNSTALPAQNARPANLYGDLNLINEEADREVLRNMPLCLQGDQTEATLLNASRPLTTARNMRTWDFWNEMNALQKGWINKVCTSTYSERGAVEHIRQSWSTLTKTFSTLPTRSLEMQLYVEMFLCDAVKLSEFLACRGCKEVSTLPVNFVTIVVGTYLKRPKHMNDHSRSWIQTREALRLVCEVPSKTDLLISILAALRELECKFLRTMTSDCIDRKISGMSYAIGQMDDLAACVSRRLHHFGLKDKLGIAH